MYKVIKQSMNISTNFIPYLEAKRIVILGKVCHSGNISSAKSLLYGHPWQWQYSNGCSNILCSNGNGRLRHTYIILRQ